jgi:TonB family protein
MGIILFGGGLVSYLTVVRRVRSSLLLLLALTTLIAIVCPVPGLAEDGIDRKVKSKVSPAYPEIARKMGLSGTVRLELVVAPNGSVKETKVIGGHPILVTAALDAVKKWKFEPAGAESTGTVEFKFSPGQ